MNDGGFQPPTPEQFAAHLQRNAPRAPSRWGTIGPAALLGLIMGIAMAGASMIGVLVGLLALAGLVGFLAWRSYRLKQLEQRATEVHELTMRRYWPQALRTAWRLLPQLRTLQELHGRTVAAMSHCLDQVKAYESAIVGFDFLIAHMPEDHPTAVQFSVQRTICQLMADRLADGDDSLRRLRGKIEPLKGTVIAAAYRLAEQIQQARTHHWDELIEKSDELIESLRPLGVDAAYGYALLGLAHHETGGNEEADLWWRRATLLLSPGALQDRFEQLTQMADVPATTRPAEVE